MKYLVVPVDDSSRRLFDQSKYIYSEKFAHVKCIRVSYFNETIKMYLSSLHLVIIASCIFVALSVSPSLVLAKTTTRLNLKR